MERSGIRGDEATKFPVLRCAAYGLPRCLTHCRSARGRNKRSALRRIVFEPSGVDMAKVPIAIRRVTASPNPPYVNCNDIAYVQLNCLLCLYLKIFDIAVEFLCSHARFR